MSAADVVKTWYAAAESGSLDAQVAAISDDFELSGPVPEPIGKDAYLGLMSALLAAFPDWSFNLSNVQEQGNVVRTTHQVTGTHTADLDLSGMGLPVVPATGTAIKLGIENPEITVENDKVVAIKVEPSPDTGVPAILKQLGVEMPPPPA
jgi:predicted ester cyclase